MELMYNIEDLSLEVEMLHRTFEVIRIIEPQRKYELKFDIGSGTVSKIPYSCYRETHGVHLCAQCIIERVFYEKKELTKFEFFDNKMLFIVARYITFQGEAYVLQTIKVVREDLVLEANGKSDFSDKITRYNQERYRDDLTGVYNRKFIQERVPGWFTKAMAEGQNISIAMVDIDYFKSINDEYGHILGDKVLCSVARTILNNISIRKGDFVARYGGDEFILVLKDITYEVSSQRMKVIGQRIQCTDIAYEDENHKIQYSISMGVANSQEVENPTLDDLYAIADKRMYMAKNKGRGCMVVTEDVVNQCN